MIDLVTECPPTPNGIARQRFAAIAQLSTAAVLIVAAVLKSHEALTVDAGTPLRWRLLQFAHIELELALAAMLILNLRPTLAWVLTVGMFTVYTGASLKKALDGAISCRCFGTIAIHPRWMATIDLLIVAALIYARPQRSQLIRSTPLRRSIAVAIGALMLLSIGATIFSSLPKRGLIADEQGYHDFGSLTPEQADGIEQTFIVRNTSSRPIRLTGSRSSCRCTAAQIPATPIQPGASAPILVRADWGNDEGDAVAQVTLETDSRWTPAVVLKIAGHILPAPATAP